jgi:hypothetical protein
LRHGGRRADLANESVADVERGLGGCTQPLRGAGAIGGLTFGQETLPALCLNLPVFALESSSHEPRARRQVPQIGAGGVRQREGGSILSARRRGRSRRPVYRRMALGTIVNEYTRACQSRCQVAYRGLRPAFLKQPAGSLASEIEGDAPLVSFDLSAYDCLFDGHF